MDVVKQLPAEADAVRSGGLLPAVLRVVGIQTKRKKSMGGLSGHADDMTRDTSIA